MKNYINKKPVLSLNWIMNLKYLIHSKNSDNSFEMIKNLI